MNTILAVTGGIAAYKSCDLINLLKRNGHDVRVIMTENAKQFIAPLTLATLSKHPIMDDMWQEKSGNVDHIEVATWAENFLVYPATANIIGKFANGIADDLLSTVYLALPKNVTKVIYPAMNTNMYNSAALKRNLKQLQLDGCAVSGTREGNLACGTKGDGCLLQPDKAFEFFANATVLENIQSGDSLEAIRAENEKLKNENEELKAALLLSVEEKCAKYHIQDCLNCLNKDCGDNLNPLLRSES